jgi:hypothetical protein
MNKLREITITSQAYSGDADWTGNPSIDPPADAEWLTLSPRHSDIESYLDFVDANGARLGLGSGTYTYYLVWRRKTGGAYTYARSSTQTNKSAGLLHRIYDDHGGPTRRTACEVTIFVTSISSAPAAAATARLFAQEV